MLLSKLSNNTIQDAGLLLLRVCIGGLMLLHGIGKLSDLLNGKTDFFDPFGIGGRASLTLVTLAEFFCSILVIIGWRLRLSLIPLIISMVVAFFIFHADDELMDKETPLLYLLNFIALWCMGSGRFSLDAVLKLRPK